MSHMLDYASEETKAKGEAVIGKHLELLKSQPVYEKALSILQRLENGERDLRL